MGSAIGFDERRKRDIGYGVPAECDHPQCDAIIDRGLGCVCGGEHYEGEHGCGLYFCDKHLLGQKCPACRQRHYPYKPKPDLAEWLEHKHTHSSWRKWRQANGIKYPANQNPRIGTLLDIAQASPALRTLFAPYEKKGLRSFDAHCHEERLRTSVGGYTPELRREWYAIRLRRLGIQPPPAPGDGSLRATNPVVRLLNERGVSVTNLAKLIGSGRSHVVQVLQNRPGRGLETRPRLAALLNAQELQVLGWTAHGQLKSEIGES